MSTAKDNPLITTPPNITSSECNSSPDTLQSKDHDENKLPSSPETLKQPPSQEDSKSSEPEPEPVETAPPEFTEEVTITTSEHDKDERLCDTVDDEIIFIEQLAPASNEEAQTDTLASVLSMFVSNNDRFADLLDMMQGKNDDASDVVKSLWQAMDNTTAVEQSVTNTLTDLNVSIDNHCETAKGHAKTLNELIVRFAKSDEEERKSQIVAGGLQTLLNTLICKSDKLQDCVDKLTTMFGGLSKELIFIRESIVAGDTKARKGLKKVDFNAIPSSVSGDTAPPLIHDDVDAPQVEDTAHAPTVDSIEGHAPQIEGQAPSVEDAANAPTGEGIQGQAPVVEVAAHAQPVDVAVADAHPQQDNSPPKVEYAPCILCGKTDHLIQGCQDYRTSSVRKVRAGELGVCTHCALVHAKDKDGKPVECTAATRQCNHCKDKLDVEQTLHHNAFCSLLSKRIEKQEEKKRKLAEAEKAQHGSAPKRPTPPPTPAHSDGTSVAPSNKNDGKSKRGPSRGGYRGGRGGKARGRR